MKNLLVLLFGFLFFCYPTLCYSQGSEIFDFIGSTETTSATFVNPYTGEEVVVSDQSLNVNQIAYIGTNSQADSIIFTEFADLLNIRNEQDQQTVVNVERFFAGLENDLLLLADATFTLPDLIVFGGSDNDILWSNIGNDTIFGEGGDDIINGGPGLDDLEGNEGNDTIRGAAGDDRLNGGTDTNQLLGGTGSDTYILGLGNDTIIEAADTALETNIAHFDAAINEPTSPNSIESVLDFSIENQDLVLTILQNGFVIRIEDQFATPDLKVDTLIFNEGNGLVVDLNTIVHAGPTTGNDVLLGTTAADTIDALAGNDEVDGLAGNDLLIGGPGADTLSGGEGNDTLFAGDLLTGDYQSNGSVAGGDFLAWQRTLGSQTELQADGNNNGQIDAGDLTVWQSNFGNVPTDGAGTTGDILRGDDGDDLLIGNAGNNQLEGGPDDDTLLGNAGNDQLEGGPGDDTLVGNAGRDTLILGEGLDTAIGGDGGDTFKFDFVDEEIDVIEDFQLGSDRIDISDILIGFQEFVDFTTDFFIAFEDGLGSTVLFVDVDGTFTNGTNFVGFAVLENVQVDTSTLEANNSLILAALQAANTVPEPTFAALALTAGLTFAVFRRRVRSCENQGAGHPIRTLPPG